LCENALRDELLNKEQVTYVEVHDGSCSVAGMPINTGTETATLRCDSTGSYASRSAVIAGGAAMLASQMLKEKMVRTASNLLEASIEHRCR
jgi:CO/xanthine dehydrogenase Mo-binding subunit